MNFSVKILCTVLLTISANFSFAAELAKQVEQAVANAIEDDDTKKLAEIIKNYNASNASDMLDDAFVLAAENNKPESLNVILDHVNHGVFHLYMQGYLMPFGHAPILLSEHAVYKALYIARKNESQEVLKLLKSLDGKLKLSPDPKSYFTWTTFNFNRVAF